MQALAERLEESPSGARRSSGVDPLGFSALKTVVPAPESVVGHRSPAGRCAGGEVPASSSSTTTSRVLLHLSQAGRLDIEEPPKKTRAEGRGGAHSASTTDRALLVREHGHERKVKWWVLAPGDPGPTERLGPEPDSDEFAELHPARRRQAPHPHDAARPAHGRRASAAATPNDALHRAHVSPYATLASARRRISVRRLLDAIRTTLAEALEAERQRTGGLSEPKLGDRFRVHNRAGTAVSGMRRRRCAGCRTRPRDHVLPDVPDQRQDPRRPPHCRGW